MSAYKVCSCLMRLQLDRKVVAVTCVESRCCTSTSRCTDALVASLVVGAQQKQFLNCFLAVKNMFVKLSYGKMAPTLIEGFKNAPQAQSNNFCFGPLSKHSGKMVIVVQLNSQKIIFF